MVLFCNSTLRVKLNEVYNLTLLELKGCFVVFNECKSYLTIELMFAGINMLSARLRLIGDYSIKNNK